MLHHLKYGTDPAMVFTDPVHSLASSVHTDSDPKLNKIHASTAATTNIFEERNLEGRCKTTCKNREAGPTNHHEDKVDSDQWVVNEEVPLSLRKDLDVSMKVHAKITQSLQTCLANQRIEHHQR